MKKIFLIIIVCLIAFTSGSLLTSCAGAKCTVSASKIDQPVSFTPCVFNHQGTIIKAKPEQILKHFKIKKSFWAMLYRSINLTSKSWDISELLSSQMAEVQGNAIVNLTIKLRGEGYWYLSCLVPVIPDVHTVLIEGDVALIPTEKK